MSDSEKAFLDELRQAFALEAGEHLQTIASGLITIEKQTDPAERQASTEAVYRAAHNLKGAARSVNLPDIGAVCQAVESVFAAMKRGALSPGAEGFDVLQGAVDGLMRMLSAPAGAPTADIAALIGQLDRLVTSGMATLPPARAPQSASSSGPVREAGIPQPSPEHAGKADAGAAPASPAALDTIRIATAKLDAILLRAEEMIPIKLAAEQRLAELAEIVAALEVWKAELEQADLPGLWAGNRDRLNDLEARLRGLLAAVRADRRATGLLVDQLLEGAKTVLMLPFSTLLQAFPKMVRDISREQNKEVDLTLAGGEIEVDKRVLERIKDPLIHLLRNCIDHGLEPPAARQAHGKKPVGSITLTVSLTEGNRVQVVVADDGAGIDAAKLREAAVQRGLLSREEAGALDDRAALALMFRSGVSTSVRVSDLSGRGLGLAIAQEAVDKLGGAIAVETTRGAGTTFRIGLPLTVATFRGLLFRESGQWFAVPTATLERVLRVRAEDIRTLENRETLLVNGTPLALARVGTLLGLAPAADASAARPLVSVMVLSSGRQRMAFAVDRLIGEQEILLKGLGRQLARVRNIAGATVLGTGEVVPVLNVADLFRTAVGAGGTTAVPRAQKAKAQRKSILVVEDSITSRMLLKNILASAGFDVLTVVDGVEAWTALKQRGFDAVVSDVQMPRMDGFELTARIRGDGKLAELPVVLVTSLESRSDRERGIEVGANAYIVKSSFEQSNLLEAIRRLI